MILVYILGLILIYRNTRNLFSFQFMFSVVSFPPAIASSDLVGWLMAIGVFFLGVGGWIYNLLSHTDPKKLLYRFRSLPVSVGVYPQRALIIVFVLVLVVALSGSLFYFYKVGISLFEDEVGYSRLVNRHAVSGSFFYQRLFRVVLPILCIMYFLMGKCVDFHLYYKHSIFIALVFITTALLVFTGMRGNVLLFLFFPALAVLGLYSHEVSIFKIFYLVLGTFLSGIFVTILMYPELNSSEILLLIWGRLSSSATDGLSYMAHIEIPDKDGLYFGKTFVNDFMSLFYKLGVTDTEYLNYGAFLAKSMLGSKYNGEQAAIYFMGELYANFGYIGLIIGSILLGFLLQKLYNKILFGPKDILFLSVKIYFCVMFLSILGGPFFSMLLDYSITVFGFLAIYILGIILIRATKGSVQINRTVLFWK